jgi:hypothetical protein
MRTDLLLVTLLLVTYFYIAVHVISYYNIVDVAVTPEIKDQAVHLVILTNIIVFFIQISLFYAATTKHEEIPKTHPWVDTEADNDKEEDPASVSAPLIRRSITASLVEVKKDGKRRYCRVPTCRTYKPDRTHHCKKCEKCIMG